MDGIQDWTLSLDREYITLPSRKLLLCTVPKAANRTIKAMAESVNARPRAEAMISRQEALRTCEDPAWWSIGFVRNPWERLVSCFFDKLVETHYDGFARQFGWRRGEVSFEEFIEGVVRIPHDEADKHVRAQHCFHQGIAKETIRIEQLVKVWPVIATRFRLPALRHENRSRSRPGDYRLMYSAGLVAKVADHYRDDIALYGYQF